MSHEPLCRPATINTKGPLSRSNAQWKAHIEKDRRAGPSGRAAKYRDRLECPERKVYNLRKSCAGVCKKWVGWFDGSLAPSKAWPQAGKAGDQARSSVRYGLRLGLAIPITPARQKHHFQIPQKLKPCCVEHNAHLSVQLGP